MINDTLPAASSLIRCGYPDTSDPTRILFKKISDIRLSATVTDNPEWIPG